MSELISDKQIDEITNKIYQYYGSGTGVLFGIPSDRRGSVRAIVRCALEISNEESKEQNRGGDDDE